MRKGTKLHQLVLANDATGVEKYAATLVAHGPTGVARLNAVEEHGFTALHKAAAMPSDKGVAVATLLLHARADISVRDPDGYTAIHWAAAVGNVSTLSALLQTQGGVAAVDALSNAKETALMRASRLGQAGCIRALVNAKADVRLRNKRRESAFDVAGVFSKRSKRSRRTAARAALLAAAPALSTLVLHHPDCLLHAAEYGSESMPPPRDGPSSPFPRTPKAKRRGPQGLSSPPVPLSSPFGKSPFGVPPLPPATPDRQGRPKPPAEQSRLHQESPRRIEAALARLKASTSFYPGEIKLSTAFDKARPGVVELAHSRKYVQMVMALGATVHGVVPLTPQVQKSVYRATRVKPADSCDTLFSKGSLGAALRAAGAVTAAVDAVVEGRHRNAFCLTRPPGHHAGVHGLLNTASSCGFCIFNNVAIGALYALKRHPDKVKRVAIVDLDAHHGNGTQEVLSARAPSDRALFLSIHVYRNTAGDYRFYPGTGGNDAIFNNAINVPVPPLWAARQQAQDASPRRTRSASPSRRSRSPTPTGRRARKKAVDDEVAVGGETGRSSAGASSAGTPSSQGPPTITSSTSPRRRAAAVSDKAGRCFWREKFEKRVLPALRAFCPDLILVSAGFDGGKDDIGNARLSGDPPHDQGLDLETIDFDWATRRIARVADICCGGRVVSVLEGGYGKIKRSKPSKPASAAIAVAEAKRMQRRNDARVKAQGGETPPSQPETDELDRSHLSACIVAHIQALTGRTYSFKNV